MNKEEFLKEVKKALMENIITDKSTKLLHFCPYCGNMGYQYLSKFNYWVFICEKCNEIELNKEIALALKELFEKTEKLTNLINFMDYWIGGCK